MVEEQRKVEEFHKTFNLEINTTPTIPDIRSRSLRLSLMEEELEELSDAMLEGSLTAVADAIGDLLYVVYGTAVTFGLDMEPIFNEIHESNMTKIGGWFREDGKYMKPSTYTPPNLGPIIQKQKETALKQED